MKRHLLVLGDTLLDRDVEGTVQRLAPDAPVPVVDESSEVTRPGGAGLAASLAARDGIEVSLLTALGDDQAGAEVARLLDGEGVRLIDIGTTGQTPEKIRIRTDGHPLMRIDRGRDTGRLGAVDRRLFSKLGAPSLLVSDYGRGITSHGPARNVIEEACREGGTVVWDPHPRGPEPVAGCRLVTPNRSEAAGFAPEIEGTDLGSVGRRAAALLRRWEVGGVVITMGAEGALFVDGGAHPLVVPAAHVGGGDPCGAGDRFAVAVTRELSRGAIPSEAVTRAVIEASRFVAGGGVGAIGHGADGVAAIEGLSEAARLAAQVRAGGGTVVATGGCFDIVHAGHVAMLESARRLGDCLIVCLNSDRSVRALKGQGRPVNRCEDRAAVLTALGSVDAVEVFDDLVPTSAIRTLKPHIWAKGGDYGATPLPEAQVLGEWGAQVVILPYLRGRSTSTILGKVAK